MSFSKVNGVCSVCDLKDHEAKCEFCRGTVAHACDFVHKTMMPKAEVRETSLKNISSGEDAFIGVLETFDVYA